MIFTHINIQCCLIRIPFQNQTYFNGQGWWNQGGLGHMPLHFLRILLHSAPKNYTPTIWNLPPPQPWWNIKLSLGYDSFSANFYWSCGVQKGVSEVNNRWYILNVKGWLCLHCKQSIIFSCNRKSLQFQYCTFAIIVDHLFPDRNSANKNIID